MSKEQRKLKKKKAKALEDRAKLIKVREKRIKERQVLAREAKERDKLRKDRVQQKRLEAWADYIAEKLPPETRSQIEHNIEILKALEEEYNKEMEAKKALNKDLEEKGASSIEEKLKLLTEDAAVDSDWNPGISEDVEKNNIQD